MRPQLYMNIDGPTPDRLGPDGQTGHFFAWDGWVMSEREIGYSVCFRGATADDCRQKAAEHRPLTETTR